MTATVEVEQIARDGLALARELEAGPASVETIARVVLRWAGEQFGEGLVLLSSMGDGTLVHLASEVMPGINVAFIDTGYHFGETLLTRDAVAASRPINLINISPVQTVAAQDVQFGERLYERDPGQCCNLRKVEPLDRALAGHHAWISGLRRDDAPTRADIGYIEFDAIRDMVKINPLAGWTQADVAAYDAREGVIANPLREFDYTSIGCAPCTRPIAPGDDLRAGRWSGLNKTECGLHT